MPSTTSGFLRMCWPSCLLNIGPKFRVDTSAFLSFLALPVLGLCRREPLRQGFLYGLPRHAWLPHHITSQWSAGESGMSTRLDSSRILQFEKLSSAVDASFWFSLAQRKLNKYQLDDSQVAIRGRYEPGRKAGGSLGRARQCRCPVETFVSARIRLKQPAGSILCLLLGALQPTVTWR